MGARSRWLLLSLAIACSPVASCHFDSSFDLVVSVDPLPPPEDRFGGVCQDVANASCDRDWRCNPNTFALQWDDKGQCISRRTLGCQLTTTAPGATYDESQIRNCILPSDYPCSGDPGWQAAADAYAMKCSAPAGTIPLGGSCTDSVGCASQWCSIDLSPDDWRSGCGVCVTAPCDGQCPADQLCSIDAAGNSSCEPRPGPTGAPCKKGTDCANLFCHDGVCQAAARVGEPCSSSLDEGATCEGGAYCAESGRCQPIVLVGQGQRCGSVGSQFLLCGHTSSSCISDGIEATCVPAAPDGAVCDDRQSLGCLGPARCLDGFCRFQPANCPAASAGDAPR